MTAPASGALAGALGTLALTDVLQLLDLGRRTGVLAVDAGDGVRRGLVRLRGGGVAAARFRDADGRELREPVAAVAGMLALGAGRFTFAPDPPDAPPPPPPAGPAALRVETLLLDAMRRLDERAAGLALDARGDAPASRVPELVDDDEAAGAGPAPVDLRAADWALLAAVDGRRTVAEVAAAAGQAPGSASELLDALAAAGLVRFRRDPAAGGVAAAPARSSHR